MAGKKLIANAIGTISFILGIAAGFFVIQAELYMNPMDYEDGYEGLFFYSYSACAFIACPFLLVQAILEHKKGRFLFVCTALCLTTLVGIFLYDKKLAGGIYLFITWPLFPLLIGRLVFRTLKWLRTKKFKGR